MKNCPCGATYSAATFAALPTPPGGALQVLDEATGEIGHLRNCRQCGSTLAWLECVSCGDLASTHDGSGGPFCAECTEEPCWRCGADAARRTDCDHRLPVCEDCRPGSLVRRGDRWEAWCADCLHTELVNHCDSDTDPEGIRRAERWIDGR